MDLNKPLEWTTWDMPYSLNYSGQSSRSFFRRPLLGSVLQAGSTNDSRELPRSVDISFLQVGQSYVRFRVEQKSRKDECDSGLT